MLFIITVDTILCSFIFSNYYTFYFKEDTLELRWLICNVSIGSSRRPDALQPFTILSTLEDPLETEHTNISRSSRGRQYIVEIVIIEYAIVNLRKSGRN